MWATLKTILSFYGMDYKEKFEDFLDKMQGLLDNAKKQGHIIVRVEDLENALTELKEGDEDERIRKSIIAILNNYVDNSNTFKPKMLSWLEKQEGCEYIKKDWLEHIKQSWYKEGFIDGKYSGGTSKEWTINDAATLKEIIDFLENGTAKLQHDLTKYANWLKIQFTPIKKQGETSTILSNSSNIGNVTLSEEEQNRFAKCVLTSCASSFIDYLDAHKYEGKMCVSNGECEDIENAFHNAMWDRLHRYYCKYIEKQGEQKPASKVEPKFKVGDWIVTRNGNVNQVVAVDKDGDGFTLDDDTYFCGPCKDSYWTIRDAKDGDVLSTPNYIYIFNSIDKETETISFYCLIKKSDKHFSFGDYRIHDEILNSTPATKEQRETLIKAMTDAGYTFEFEKKELKKIAPSNKELEGKV